jgi:tetratricopeptide (TPR) repeat protein
MGSYTQALVYATRCHELAETFDDPSLFIRALYLESAIYRALAAKEASEGAQQAMYMRAVEICEKAAELYSQKGIEDVNLKGKIYFNLGAAHADNPQGDLERAGSCYATALGCFKEAGNLDDIIRVCMRLGRVYLLQSHYERCQHMINVVRPLISNERLSMHADYLEAQLKLAENEINEALRLVRSGLEKARALGAKEDEARLISLLEKISNQ